MMGKKKKSTKTIVVAVALALCSVVGFVIFGGAFPLVPDKARGAKADTGNSRNGMDRFTAYNYGNNIYIHHFHKKGRTRLKDAHPGNVKAIAVSLDSKTMATAGGSNKIRLWDITPLGNWFFKSPTRIAELTGNTYDIKAMAFSKNGKQLVVVGEDGETVDVWDIDAQKLLAEERGLSAPTDSFLLKVDITPQGEVSDINISGADLVYRKESLSGVERQGMDAPYILRDTISGHKVNTFKKASTTSWSSNGRYLGYAQDSSVLIWKLCSGNVCKNRRTQS